MNKPELTFTKNDVEKLHALFNEVYPDQMCTNETSNLEGIRIAVRGITICDLLQAMEARGGNEPPLLFQRHPKPHDHLL